MPNLYPALNPLSVAPLTQPRVNCHTPEKDCSQTRHNVSCHLEPEDPLIRHLLRRLLRRGWFSGIEWNVGVRCSVFRQPGRTTTRIRPTTPSVVTVVTMAVLGTTPTSASQVVLNVAWGAATGAGSVRGGRGVAEVVVVEAVVGTAAVIEVVTVVLAVAGRPAESRTVEGAAPLLFAQGVGEGGETVVRRRKGKVFL